MEDVEGVGHPQNTGNEPQGKGGVPEEGKEHRRQDDGHQGAPKQKHLAVERLLFLDALYRTMNVLEKLATRRGVHILLLGNRRDFPVHIKSKVITQKENVRAGGVSPHLQKSLSPRMLLKLGDYKRMIFRGRGEGRRWEGRRGRGRWWRRHVSSVLVCWLETTKKSHRRKRKQLPPNPKPSSRDVKNGPQNQKKPKK